MHEHGPVKENVSYHLPCPCTDKIWTVSLAALLYLRKWISAVENDRANLVRSGKNRQTRLSVGLGSHKSTRLSASSWTHRLSTLLVAPIFTIATQQTPQTPFDNSQPDSTQACLRLPLPQLPLHLSHRIRSLLTRLKPSDGRPTLGSASRGRITRQSYMVVPKALLVWIVANAPVLYGVAIVMIIGLELDLSRTGKRT
nr:hypothetical protein CFP56_09641 [Quercus suber]